MTIYRLNLGCEASSTAVLNNIDDSASSGRFLGMIKSLRAASMFMGVMSHTQGFSPMSLIPARRLALEAAGHVGCNWRSEQDLKSFSASIRAQIKRLGLDTDADEATRAGVCQSQVSRYGVELAKPEWFSNVQAQDLACSRLKKVLPIAKP